MATGDYLVTPTANGVGGQHGLNYFSQLLFGVETLTAGPVSDATVKVITNGLNAGYIKLTADKNTPTPLVSDTDLAGIASTACGITWDTVAHKFSSTSNASCAAFTAGVMFDGTSTNAVIGD